MRPRLPNRNRDWRKVFPGNARLPVTRRCRPSPESGKPLIAKRRQPRSKSLFLFLGRKVNRVGIAGTIPRGPAMKDAGASADGIDCATREINQEMVTRLAFYPAGNILVQQILSQHPQKTADRRHHQINLSHARVAFSLCAWPGAILVPRRPNFASVFLDRYFTERSDIPLRAV